MQIKFITINIWFGGKVWDNLISYIKAEKPDILALQEVYDGHDGSLEKRYRTMEEFANELGSFLPFNAFGATVLDSGVNVTWGNAVFSKFPIINRKTIFFDLPYTEYSFTLDTDPRLAAEGMLECELDVDGRKAFIYSWHGVWDNHGNDSPSRFEMERVIVENLKDKQAVILAGDSNMRHKTKVIENIGKKLALENVFGDGLVSTFNMNRKTQPFFAKESVDKIFLSPEFKVLEKEMPKVDVSDHYPLKVLLEF